MVKKKVAKRTTARPWRGDPRDVRPMLAVLAEQTAHDRILRKPNLVFEPKYDGIRALVAIDPRTADTSKAPLGARRAARAAALRSTLASAATRPSNSPTSSNHSPVWVAA